MITPLYGSLTPMGRSYGTAVAAFSPASVSGLIAWYKSDSGSGLYQASSGTGSLAAANGDPVGFWTDQSGTRNATQSTSGAKPTLATAALNGLPVVRFTTSTYMSFSSVALSGAWTLYIVGNSIAGQNFALGGPTNGYIGYYNSGGSYVVDDVNFSPNYPGNATTRSVVIRAHRSGAGANVGYKTTGVSELSQSSTLGTITISEIMRRASPAIACAGDVGEVILYNTDLSTTDKSSVEAYILSKWGVAT